MLILALLACKSDGKGKNAAICKTSGASHPEPDDDGFRYADVDCDKANVWVDGKDDYDSLGDALEAAKGGSVVTVCDVQFTLPAFEIDGSACSDTPDFALEGLGLAQFSSAEGDRVLELTGVDATIAGFGFRNGEAAKGGSVSIVDADVTFVGSNFTGGSATEGGAIHADADSHLTLKDCQLNDNEADRGGAVYAAGDFTLEGGLIRENKGTTARGVFVGGSAFLTDAEMSGNSSLIGDRTSLEVDGDLQVRGAFLELERVQVGGWADISDLTATDSFLKANSADIRLSSVHFSEDVEAGIAIELTKDSVLTNVDVTSDDPSADDVGVFVLRNTELAGVVISGFGTGLEVDTSVELRNSIVEKNNYGLDSYGDVTCDENTKFRLNAKAGADLGFGTVAGCSFLNNDGPGIEANTDVTIDSCWIASNRGGIEVDGWDGRTVVRRTLIEDNVGPVGGLDLSAGYEDFITVELIDTDVINNTGDGSKSRSVGGAAVGEGVTLISKNTQWVNTGGSDIAVEVDGGFSTDWEFYTVGGIADFTCIGFGACQ